MKIKKNKIPNFGMNVTENLLPDGKSIQLSCRYKVPGLTMHDLMMIFEKGKNHPDNSHYAANPSLWPDVRGLSDVVNAILEAVYSDIEKRKTKNTPNDAFLINQESVTCPKCGAISSDDWLQCNKD